MGAATDAPAELVELGQPEGVGAVDQDRVGVGDVEARFDDGRAQQHVRFAAVELQHRGFQRPRVHLAVSDDEPGLRHQVLQPRAHPFDVLHAVVHEEDLPAAAQLPKDGFPDDAFAETDYLGADRQPVRGRCLDHRQVPEA